MPEVLVATPLHYCVATGPQTFSDGLSICQLGPILWEKALSKAYISEDDRNYMNEDRYWLCAREEFEYILPDTGDHLYDKVSHGAWSLQILFPCGAKNIFLKFHETAEGFDNIGTRRLKELCTTRLSPFNNAAGAHLATQFESIYGGVRRAFTERIVRLQNPILLIEHGMQTGNVPLANMMSAMALDMLFMAGETKSFITRIGGCLGLDRLVFHENPIAPGYSCRPDVKVGNVIEDIYAFRNIIAHGAEIPKTPYRESHAVLGIDGVSIYTGQLTYAELLADASLAILTMALREVFINGWLDDIVAKDPWKAKMTLFAHRYKNAQKAVS